MKIINMHFLRYTYPKYKKLLEEDRPEYREHLLIYSNGMDPIKIATNRLQNIYNTTDGTFSTSITSIILQNNDTILLNRIVSQWLPNNQLPIDVQLNLFHYITMNSEDYNRSLTVEQREYIGNASVNELLQLLGPNYINKPLDHASLLFAALTGLSTPMPNIRSNWILSIIIL